MQLTSSLFQLHRNTFRCFSLLFLAGCFCRKWSRHSCAHQRPSPRPPSTSKTTKCAFQTKRLFSCAEMTLEASSAWSQMVSIDYVSLVISAEKALTILYSFWIHGIWNYCEPHKYTSDFLHKRELPESQTGGTNLIFRVYLISLNQKLVNRYKD